MALLVAGLAAGAPSAAAGSASVVSPQTPVVASAMIGVGVRALAPPPTARAGDCCMGWVYISVKAGTTLSPRVPLRIYGDDPDHHYDATVTPHLSVGGHHFARVPAFTVPDVSPTTARQRVLRIPRATVARAARYGRRSGHHRAVLTFVFKQVVDRSTGTPMPNYAIDTYLRLPAPAARQAATAAASAGQGVAPLQVPDTRGKLHVSGTEHISFALPAGQWELARRADGRVMYDGSYVRRLTVHGRSCKLLLGFGGRGQRQRPVLRVIRGGRDVRSGQRDGTSWLSWRFSTPTARQGSYARGYREAPTGRTWRWLAMNVLVEPLGQTASAGCNRAAVRADVAAGAASARIAQGRLPKPN